MLPPTATSLTGLFARLAAFAAVTALLVALASRGIAPERVCPDFIQFWTAASLLAEGSDPYDPALQAVIQQGLGWDKVRNGFGIYEFLPYYYPPWLALAFIPLLPLGYATAKFAWLVLGAEMLLAAGWLLKDTVRGIPGPLALTVVALFGFSIRSVAMGQVAPLVLVLIASAWWLLDRRRDFAAGCVLVPALTLMGSRLAGLPRAMLAGTLLLLPSLHILRLAADYATPVVGVRRPEFTYFWIPLLIGLLWLNWPANGRSDDRVRCTSE